MKEAETNMQNIISAIDIIEGLEHQATTNSLDDYAAAVYAIRALNIIEDRIRAKVNTTQEASTLEEQLSRQKLLLEAGILEYKKTIKYKPYQHARMYIADWQIA